MVSARLEISFLLPFAAGNLVYIGASDLVPEVNKHRDLGASIILFLCFVVGLGLHWLMRGVVTQ